MRAEATARIDTDRSRAVNGPLRLVREGEVLPVRPPSIKTPQSESFLSITGTYDIFASQGQQFVRQLSQPMLVMDPNAASAPIYYLQDFNMSLTPVLSAAEAELLCNFKQLDEARRLAVEDFCEEQLSLQDHLAMIEEAHVVTAQVLDDFWGGDGSEENTL